MLSKQSVPHIQRPRQQHLRQVYPPPGLPVVVPQQARWQLWLVLSIHKEKQREYRQASTAELSSRRSRMEGTPCGILGDTAREKGGAGGGRRAGWAGDYKGRVSAVRPPQLHCDPCQQDGLLRGQLLGPHPPEQGVSQGPRGTCHPWRSQLEPGPGSPLSSSSHSIPAWALSQKGHEEIPCTRLRMPPRSP